jgi:DNA-binding NarL/FixJ family response regulator
VVRVVLVDDHAVFRDSLEAVLVPAVGTTVVGSFGRADEALAALGALDADVVIMDLSLPDTGGVEATRQIVRRFPHVRILVLSMSDDAASVRASLRAGARGYLAKSSGLPEMVRAIQAVHDGQLILGSTVAGLVDAAAPRDSRAALLTSLTSREADVLELLAGGRTTGQMAAELGVTQKTIRNVLSTLYAKLGVEDRGQAALTARELLRAR